MGDNTDGPELALVGGPLPSVRRGGVLQEGERVVVRVRELPGECLGAGTHAGLASGSGSRWVATPAIMAMMPGRTVVLARAAWGQGLMTEALRAVVELGLAETHLYRIAAVCDVDNRPSARVLEKAGMQREGRLRRYILHPNVSAEPRDVYLYARTR